MAYFFGGSGNDGLVGTILPDLIDGFEGNDTLDGNLNADTLRGGPGNDDYLVESYADQVIEVDGEGVDRIVLAATLTSHTLQAHIENLTLTGQATASGNDLHNVLVGSSSHSAALSGEGGNDHLRGGQISDTLDGGVGNDSVEGGGGDDVLRGQEGNDTLDGGTGADHMAGGAGDDTYRFGSGDVIDEDPAGGGRDRVISSVDITLASALEDADLIGTAVNATGNDMDNRLVGNELGNLLQGGRGADTLAGNKGNDTLNGGTGADLLIGGQGNDTYHLGTGDRIQEVASGGGHDTVLSSVTSLTLDAALEDLELVGAAVVGNGNNTANRITGNALANVLQGGQGNDMLMGMGGDDTLVGGRNRDVLTGGDGNDTFRFTHLLDSTVAAPDTVADLAAGDRLDFGAIDANTLLAGDQAFAHVAAYSGQAGQLILTYDSGQNRTEVAVDVNGDSMSDMVIHLTGQHTSTAGWLL